LITTSYTLTLIPFPAPAHPTLFVEAKARARALHNTTNPHRNAVLEVVADPRDHGGAGVPELALEPELHERPVQLREINLPCNQQRTIHE